jgi:hypothetical protein
MDRNAKTGSTSFTSPPLSITHNMESWVTRILVRFLIITANLDPEVLQWPGGAIIASVLCLCMTARSFWTGGLSR